MNKTNYWFSAVASLFLLLAGVHAQAQNGPDKWTGNQKRAHVKCGTHSLQAAVDRAAEGAEIVVDGVCTEAVVIEKDRIRISGTPGATVQAPAGSIAFTVLADGVVISDLAIVGGLIGIDIAKGASADITGNDIRDYSESGIVIRANSNAEIIGNVIDGPDGSFTAIGLIAGASAQIAGNVITSRGFGINVGATSSAFLSDNTVTLLNPGFVGLVVGRTSHLGFEAGRPNTVINTGPGAALFCSQTSSMLVSENQTLEPAFFVHPTCEVLRLNGATIP